MKKWKTHQHLLNHFTTLWRKDYLLNLRECHALKSKEGSKSPIEVVQMVILKDDTTKRLFWKLAIVEELLPGRDGKIRSVKVKVSNPSRTSTMLHHSIQHLVPLEINRCNHSSSIKWLNYRPCLNCIFFPVILI